MFALLFQLAAFAPPQAADHVVRLEIDDGPGMSSRTVFFRSGSRVRSESNSSRFNESNYTDLATGRVVSALRDANGVMQQITIYRSLDRTRRLPPTGRQDRMLGERCTIWRLSDENGSTNEICETADGILLWQAFWYPPGDQTHMYMHASRIERRAVRAEEVLPPRGLLALAAESPPRAPVIAGAVADFEVEMAGDDPVDGSYVLRRHGSFSSRERRQPGEHSLEFSNGAVRVSYGETEAAAPISLQISRAGYRTRLGRVPQWENVPGRASERLLGETCVWQENVAIRGTDQFYECRTADGIPLKTETNFEWTGVRRFTARRLSRRALRDEDFAPPARALDWATWGITPAP